MKKLIIHLTGTVCSGKTTIIHTLCSEYKDSDIVSAWDIAEWYRENNVIIDNEFIFENYMAKRHKLWNDFRKFAAQNKNSMIYILESSGSNKEINHNINQIDKTKIDVILIRMVPPIPNEVIKRANLRNDISEEKALDMLDLYNKTCIPEEELNEEETYFYIKEWIKYYEQRDYSK